MRKRIVIVDDNVASLTIAKAILSPHYNAIPVTSSEQLFRLLQKFTPDLILMDIEMPEMNGFEAFEILKKMGIAVNVIFLSGNSESESIQKALEAGAADYICKPFAVEDLLYKVGRYSG